MNEKKRVEDMSRSELVREAAGYGWVAEGADTDADLRSVVSMGREGTRWHAKAA
jgi:hypothetical protein